jgi:peptidylprolyl isomerase
VLDRRVLTWVTAACAAGALAAGCGSSSTSSTVVPQALGGGQASSACSTSTTACTVAAPTPGQPTAPPACTNAGSGRTDDFHQQVALTAQPDGLQIGDIKVGDGAVPKPGQFVTVAYSGWLQDGTLFDSSRKPGAQPFAYQLGSGQAIPGFDEAIATMHVGGIRRAVLPPQLAYGPQGQGPIPPNATLTFDLELLCAT